MFKDIIRFFTRSKYQNLGAIPYRDSESEKLVNQKELVAKTMSPNWNKQINPNKFSFKVRNQSTSSSCVAFTRALIWSIMYFFRTGVWVDFSARWVYSQRTNTPEEGMSAQDKLDLGMIPDDLMPSDNLPESEMNKPPKEDWLYDLAKTFLMGSPIVVSPCDIDAIASTIEATGKPFQVFVLFGPSEWGKVPKILGNKTPYCHSITILPEYGIYEGKKAVLAQDSWGKDLETIDGKRIITEDFFNKRVIFAQYWMNFKFDKQKSKPKYDGSIVSLQDCLKYEGIFPTNVDSTGYFGNITKQAVIEFQLKYKISPALGIVGPKTEAKLKELYK